MTDEQRQAVERLRRAVSLPHAAWKIACLIAPNDLRHLLDALVALERERDDANDFLGRTQALVREHQVAADAATATIAALTARVARLRKAMEQAAEDAVDGGDVSVVRCRLYLALDSEPAEEGA